MQLPLQGMRVKRADAGANASAGWTGVWGEKGVASVIIGIVEYVPCRVYMPSLWCRNCFFPLLLFHVSISYMSARVQEWAGDPGTRRKVQCCSGICWRGVTCAELLALRQMPESSFDTLSYTRDAGTQILSTNVSTLGMHREWTTDDCKMRTHTFMQGWTLADHNHGSSRFLDIVVSNIFSKFIHFDHIESRKKN